ncbi:MAG: tetratricopeptide repeat protein [bacterium]
MKGESRIPEHEDINDLLTAYEKLRSGRGTAFLSEESFERIIDHFDDQDALSRALEAAEIATLQFPFSASLLVKKADLLIASRQYKKALTLLDKAQILDRNDIDIYILRTDAYLALDMQAKAVAILEEALLQFEGEERIDLLFELADVYDDYEEFEKIFDCLKLILEYEPNNEEALYKICFWTDFTGRNEESIKLHLKIIDAFPYNELAWFNLAAAYQGLRLFEKAIDAYQYAIVINEKFDYAYRNMADAFMRLHRYKEAIDALEKVIELSRPEDVIYQAIGFCYEKIKNYAQARFYYRKASHLNPDDAKLYVKVAGTYMKELKYSSAIKYLDMALRIKRLDPEFNLIMGECLVKTGKAKDAVHYFLAAVQSKPRNIKGWESLIRTLFETGQYTDAEKNVEHARARLGDKPILGFYQSAILLAMGKIKEGMKLLESSAEKNPRSLKSFLKLYPSSVKHTQVVELILRYKRRRRL